MAQTNLELRSERIHWIREDGTKYYPKFSLAVNATGFNGIEDPDAMVDMAMELYPLKEQ